MTTLQQGPGLMPRNWLADQLRGYGLNQLADRANSPTSGLGIVADGVGGVANLLMQPVQSFQEMLANPYQRGGTDDRFVGNAFDVAGGAMTGGVLAPRPKGLAEPYAIRAYRGSPVSEHNPSLSINKDVFWATADKNLAGEYATNYWGWYGDTPITPNVMPVDMKFRNPLVIDNATSVRASSVPLNGRKYLTDDLAEVARSRGHDGLIVHNAIDPPTNDSTITNPTSIYAALRPGTVYSSLTGELLFANGGRPGAAAGALGNLLAGYGYPQPAQPQPPADWTRNLRPGDI